MVRLSNILRLILHFSLVAIYGKYLEDILSFPFLVFSFLLLHLLTYLLYRRRLRSYVSLLIIFSFPWLVRLIIILINRVSPSFLQIDFDMNFFVILFPLYISAILSWYSFSKTSFRKYEVLFLGFFLFLLFWKQGNYQITLVPNPAYLALFTIIFLLLSLLVLYLSVSIERNIKKKWRDSVKEFSLFYILLIPLVIYLLLPLWKSYEEGSVAGGGGLLKSSMFRFDFSEYVKLETEISMSDDLVLMFRKEGPAERLLLRRYVLSGYEPGQGFFRDEIDKKKPPSKLIPRYAEFEQQQYKSREKVKQEFFLVNIDPTAFLSLNYPINSQPIYNWDNSSFIRIYKSDAMVSTQEIREIDPLISMAADDLSHYIFTGDNEELEKTAKDLTAGIPGSLLKVIAIEDYFHKNYYYSLKPGIAPDGDQLTYFINESKKGYCSYFAFSMALMCRSLGIPSRVVVGFWVDPDVSVLNFYPVRADQAHAWVEVFFNEYGWIEFDPTSSIMFPGEQYPFASFTIDEFSPLIEEILDNELMAENLVESREQSVVEDEDGNLLKGLYGIIRQYWYVFLSVFYVFYIFYLKYLPIISYHLSRSNRKKAGNLYRTIRSALAFEKKSFKESHIEYALRVEQRYGLPVRDITDIYLKAVFSPHFTEVDLEELVYKKELFFKLYRDNIFLGRRILLFIFPFMRSNHK